jgi:hypothetical protein
LNKRQLLAQINPGSMPANFGGPLPLLLTSRAFRGKLRSIGVCGRQLRFLGVEAISPHCGSRLGLFASVINHGAQFGYSA